MRKFRNTVKLSILIFTALFAINTAVLHVFFNINIFERASLTQSAEAAEQNGNSDSNASPGYYPQWNTKEYDEAYSNENLKDNSSTNLQSMDQAQNTGEYRSTDEANSTDELQNTREVFMTASQVADLEKLDIRDKPGSCIHDSKAWQ